MPRIPRDRTLDATLAFRRDPYRFVSRRADRLGTDVFETRLLLRRTVCARGPDAAEVFYDPDRFRRSGAVPGRFVRTLFGRGGVQGLDGDAHRHRKAMLLAILGPERIGGLRRRAMDEWRRAAKRFESAGRIVLYDEAREVLARAVSTFAGVPLPEEDATERTEELASLYEGAGAIGPAHGRARRARRRLERRLAGFVEEIRAGRVRPPAESAAAVVAGHSDPEGRLLDPRVAAVELLNVLRPTVAIAVFVAFAAHALVRHPAWRERLAADGEEEAAAFANEVRRFYPFFPVVAARVRRDFEWRGYAFPAGRRVLLDLYGTDHHPSAWDAPEEFRPERFLGRTPGPYELVAQGGGGHAENHRCAGEWATIGILSDAARFLAAEVEFDVPEQDLEIDFGSLPALPRSGVALENVRLRPPARARPEG